MKFILIILSALFLSVPALGASVQDEQAAALGVSRIEDAVPDEARELLDGVSAENASPGAFKFLALAARDKFFEILKASFGGCVTLIAVVVLGGLLGAFFEDGPPRAAILAGVLAITAVSVVETGSVMREAKGAIEQMDAFTKLLLPAVASAVTASGGYASGAALYAAAMAFSQTLIALINRLLLPLTTAYIALSAANAALGGAMLGKLAKAIKWAATISLTGIMLVYVGFLTLSGVVSSTTDALALKAAKTTLSTVVPVVGGIMSDAAGTILSSAAVLKNSLGVFGMLAVLAMTMTPFLYIGARYLAYKLTAALCSTVAGDETTALIDAVSTAFGLVLAMTSCCALMTLIALVSAVKMTA